MKIKVERIPIAISAAAIAEMASNPLALGGYKLLPGGFCQVYSAVLSFIPKGTPYVAANGSRFVIRYGGATGPACVDPLPAQGLIDQTQIATGIFQPISCMVLPAPIFLCLEGGAPTTLGNGVLEMMLTCHDPQMKLLEDEF